MKSLKMVLNILSWTVPASASPSSPMNRAISFLIESAGMTSSNLLRIRRTFE